MKMAGFSYRPKSSVFMKSLLISISIGRTEAMAVKGVELCHTLLQEHELVNSLNRSSSVQSCIGTRGGSLNVMLLRLLLLFMMQLLLFMMQLLLLLLLLLLSQLFSVKRSLRDVRCCDLSRRAIALSRSSCLLMRNISWWMKETMGWIQTWIWETSNMVFFFA